MISQPTLEQLRARHAWDVVDGMRGVLLKDFAREVKRLPARIRVAGLGQALAFLYAKAGSSDKDARGYMLQCLAAWLLDERMVAARPKRSSGRDAVIRALMDGDAGLLRHLTEEALLYLQWLSRFAEANSTEDDPND